MNPLALWALPLKGEKSSGSECNSNKYPGIISPLGEMSRSDRGVLSVEEIPRRELRSDRGVFTKKRMCAAHPFLF